MSLDTETIDGIWKSLVQRIQELPLAIPTLCFRSSKCTNEELVWSLGVIFPASVACERLFNYLGTSNAFFFIAVFLGPGVFGAWSFCCWMDWYIFLFQT